MANHNLSKIKAIVFDLDDTLYPQIEYKRSGFRVVASWMSEEWGSDPTAVLHELEKILNQYGASYPNIFDRLAERLELQPDIVPMMVREFIDHDPQIHCFDGVVSMLERLRKKYQLGILTDGRLSVQKKKEKALGLDKLVDQTLFSDALGMQKPAIELFKWFENVFALHGEQLMYVGDNPKKDFWGASQRNWTTICVMTGEENNANVPDDYQPRYSIPSVMEIERILIGKPEVI